jgi:hypothetical protein
MPVAKGTSTAVRTSATAEVQAIAGPPETSTVGSIAAQDKTGKKSEEASNRRYSRNAGNTNGRTGKSTAVKKSKQ